MLRCTRHSVVTSPGQEPNTPTPNAPPTTDNSEPLTIEMACEGAELCQALSNMCVMNLVGFIYK